MPDMRKSTRIMARNSMILTRVLLYTMLGVIPIVSIPVIPEGGKETKTLVFLLFLSILVILYPFGLTNREQLKFCVTRIDICLLILFCYIGLQSIFLGHVITEQHVELFGFLFLYIIVRFIHIKYVDMLLLVLISCATFQTIYGLLQLAGAFPTNNATFHITGSFNNPGPFGEYLAMLCVLALSCYRLPVILNSKILLFLRDKKVFNIILVLIIMAVVFSQSRAAWIALIASALILFYPELCKYVNNRRLRKRYIVSFLLLIGMLIFVGLFYYKVDSSYGRLYIWKIACSVLNKHNVVSGIGFGYFNPVYMQAQENYFKNVPTSYYAEHADNVLCCFNDVLQALIELGLLGLIIIVILFFSVYKSTTTSSLQILSRTLKCSLLCILISSFFSYPHQIISIKVTVCICLALLSSLEAENSITNIICKIKPYAKFFLFCVISGSGFLGIIYTYKYGCALKSWKMANYYYSDYRYKESLPFYDKAFQFFKYNGLFLNNFGKALSLAQKYEESNNVMMSAVMFNINTYSYTTIGHNYEKLNKVTLAEEFYWKAHWLTPAKDYPLYLLIKLYDKNGDSAKVLELGNYLLKKRQRIYSVAAEQMKSEVKNIINKHKQ